MGVKISKHGSYNFQKRNKGKKRKSEGLEEKSSSFISLSEAEIYEDQEDISTHTNEQITNNIATASSEYSNPDDDKIYEDIIQESESQLNSTKVSVSTQRQRKSWAQTLDGFPHYSDEEASRKVSNLTFTILSEEANGNTSIIEEENESLNKSKSDQNLLGEETTSAAEVGGNKKQIKEGGNWKELLNGGFWNETTFQIKEPKSTNEVPSEQIKEVKKTQRSKTISSQSDVYYEIDASTSEECDNEDKHEFYDAVDLLNEERARKTEDAVDFSISHPKLTKNEEPSSNTKLNINEELLNSIGDSSVVSQNTINNYYLDEVDALEPKRHQVELETDAQDAKLSRLNNLDIGKNERIYDFIPHPNLNGSQQIEETPGRDLINVDDDVITLQCRKMDKYEDSLVLDLHFEEEDEVRKVSIKLETLNLLQMKHIETVEEKSELSENIALLDSDKKKKTSLNTLQELSSSSESLQTDNEYEITYNNNLDGRGQNIQQCRKLLAEPEPAENLVNMNKINHAEAKAESSDLEELLFVKVNNKFPTTPRDCDSLSSSSSESHETCETLEKINISNLEDCGRNIKYAENLPFIDFHHEKSPSTANTVSLNNMQMSYAESTGGKEEYSQKNLISDLDELLVVKINNKLLTTTRNRESPLSNSSESCETGANPEIINNSNSADSERDILQYRKIIRNEESLLHIEFHSEGKEPSEDPNNFNKVQTNHAKSEEAKEEHFQENLISELDELLLVKINNELPTTTTRNSSESGETRDNSEITNINNDFERNNVPYRKIIRYEESLSAVDLHSQEPNNLNKLQIDRGELNEAKEENPQKKLIFDLDQINNELLTTTRNLFVSCGTGDKLEKTNISNFEDPDRSILPYRKIIRYEESSPTVDFHSEEPKMTQDPDNLNKTQINQAESTEGKEEKGVQKNVIKDLDELIISKENNEFCAYGSISSNSSEDFEIIHHSEKTNIINSESFKASILQCRKVSETDDDSSVSDFHSEELDVGKHSVNLKNPQNDLEASVVIQEEKLQTNAILDLNESFSRDSLSDSSESLGADVKLERRDCSESKILDFEDMSILDIGSDEPFVVKKTVHHLEESRSKNQSDEIVSDSGRLLLSAKANNAEYVTEFNDSALGTRKCFQIQQSDQKGTATCESIMYVKDNTLFPEKTTLLSCDMKQENLELDGLLTPSSPEEVAKDQMRLWEKEQKNTEIEEIISKLNTSLIDINNLKTNIDNLKTADNKEVHTEMYYTLIQIMREVNNINNYNFNERVINLQHTAMTQINVCIKNLQKKGAN